MRLGYHYHLSLQREDGRLRTTGAQGRFLDALARHFERLVCFFHEPMPAERPTLDYCLQAQNIEWVNIGPRDSVPKRILRSWATVRQIRRARSSLDAMLVRGPSTLLPAVCSASRPLPLALLIVGSYSSFFSESSQPAWRKAPIALWLKYNGWRQRRLMKRSLTIVNSHALYSALEGRLPELHEVRTTTLTGTDFFEREDTCRDETIRLLYVGRIDAPKGLPVLLSAAAPLLKQEDVRLTLDVVGPAAQNDSTAQEVERQVQQLGLRDRVRFHGHKPLGPELFAFYRKADIFVMPSRGNEGFPRTIWEAMAHSVPVICSAVGSVPDYLRHAHDAYLVPPGDVRLLGAAILRLTQDSQLRRTLIRNGQTMVRHHTVEAHAAQIAGLIHSWAERSRSPVNAAPARQQASPP